ncbi:MAG TPA: IS66 family transposase, partial [Lacunisphaera sp.]|nr:IS66 family transposase [Lacunisphaera sp.]
MPPLAELPQAYLAVTRERDALQGELRDLQRQLAWLRRQVFGGPKSEALDRQQLLLQLRELEALAAKAEAPRQTIAYERATPAPAKRALPAELFAHLPVRETVVIEPAEVQAAPAAYERIGEERTFEVELTPPQLFKREIVRPKYRAKADRAQPPLLAPAPARPVPGGYASAGLLTWVVLAKYLDHLPLYRQERMLGRWGATIPRQTLCEWIRIASEWLEPLYRLMLERLRAGGYVQADETPIKCQDPDAPGNGTTQGYLWVIGRPGSDVCFDWRMSRRHGETTTLLGQFAGVLQADGYAAYDAHAERRPAVIRVGCWAHARRKWVEAQAENPRATRVALQLIARLYRHERAWDEADVAAQRIRDADERARLRQRHFARSLRWLHALALKLRAQVRPKSGLGEATSYLLAQWAPLTRQVQHGITRLDNNLIENAIRPSAVGKKNWLFIGHPEAGQRTAILYSIIVSC